MAGVEWRPCRYYALGCDGAAVGDYSECLAHLPPASLDTVLAGFREWGPLDARGTRIRASLLHRILAAAPVGDDRRELRNAVFSKAIFIDVALFDHAQFDGNALFEAARFSEGAQFRWARFTGTANFRSVDFAGAAMFDHVEFVGAALFSEAQFYREARFKQTRFRSAADFDQVTFFEDASFGDAEFVGDAEFRRSRFRRATPFRRVRFGADANFSQARFQDAPLPLEAAVEGEAPAQLEAAGMVMAPSRRQPLRLGPPPSQRDSPEAPRRPRVEPPATADPPWRQVLRLLVEDRRAPQAGTTGDVQPEKPVRKPLDFAGSTEAMRDSTKWIAAAFAGVGLVLAAGLQLGKLGQLNLGDWRLQVAMLAMVVGLAGIGAVIWLASRVLASRYIALEAMTRSRKPPAIDWLWDVPGARKYAISDLEKFLSKRRELEASLPRVDTETRAKVEEQLGELNQIGDDALTIANHLATRKSYVLFRLVGIVVAVLVVLAVAVFAMTSNTRTLDSPVLIQLTTKGREEKAGVLGRACVESLIPALVTRPVSVIRLVGDPGRAGGRSGMEVLVLPIKCRGQLHRFPLESRLGKVVGSTKKIAINSLQQPRRVPRVILTRPSPGSTDNTTELEFGYGHHGDTHVVGHWESTNSDTTNGKVDTIGVHRGDRFYLRTSNTSGGADLAFRYGRRGDTPLVGDWDGDGIDTIGVRRGGSFLLRNSNSPGPADLRFRFGEPGERPLVGDWDGDGKDTIGVQRGNAFLLRNRNSAGPAERSIRYEGQPTDRPLVGDWDGDGKDTIGVRRGTVLYLQLEDLERTRGARPAGGASQLEYGQAGDALLVGNWHGDRTDELGRQHGILLCTADSCGSGQWREAGQDSQPDGAR